MTLTTSDAIRELKRISRFSPFFVKDKLNEAIKAIEKEQPVRCGHCTKIKVQDDGVFYCTLYNVAKPWDGYCEKGKER